MYCNFCNSQLPEGAYVCAVCGHNNTPAQSAPAPAAKQVNEAPAAKPAAPKNAAPVSAPAAKAKKAADPLSNGVSSFVWACLSVIMSFGGLFLSAGIITSMAGIAMAIISKIKAKGAKASTGTAGAAFASAAGAASTFGLIASICTLAWSIFLYALLVLYYIFIFSYLFFMIFISLLTI